MKILITGGKSATALKLLKAFTEHEMVLADYDEVPSFSSAAYRFVSLGAKNEDTLAHTLLNNCLDENVAAILPLHDFEIEALAKATILFKEFNIEVLLPNQGDLMQYLNSKKSTNWAVFNHGNLIFATEPNETLIALAQATHLNGAYYVSEDDGQLNLALITI
ncbi:hypothetical protein [Pedobacter sp. Hv1]|uniref:hypothetical protein n=1 Tax=Pedobacter sp. Hv1 TaxID=1740090 RepID=UPI0006D8BF2E|nr:hypothetical protein [Pedobacter sp. Hv1]KQC02151.1 hypothetical protein AQF98_00830 [Pedobacter sp. Hv1]